MGGGASLGTSVMLALVDDIVSGRLLPGSPLPPENDLCEQFGVSRTVIREAVKVVQEKGLVRVAHGKGTQVTEESHWNLVDDVVLTALIRHDETSSVLDEVVAVRTAIEADLAAAAAALATPDELAAVAAELRHMETLLHVPGEFGASDVRFHAEIMRASHNRLGTTVVTSIHDKARTSERYHGEYSQSVMRLTLAEHQAILDALTAGDPERASAAMRTHILTAWARRRPNDRRQASGS
jgi:DNA-binding FadR family transcriptional regulator